MSNSHYQFLTPQEIESVIRKLEYGFAEHIRWFNGLYRSRICGLPVPEIYLAKEAHRLCNFGRWYHNTSSPIVKERKDFVMIDRLHRAMHDNALILAVKTKQGEEITVNLAPDRDIFKLLKGHKKHRPKQDVKTALSDALPGRLAQLGDTAADGHHAGIHLV